MTKEQALEKKLEQVRWQFPNHVVFKHNNRVYHYDPNNVDEENIFSRIGLEVFKEEDGNVVLFDPKYFYINGAGCLAYKSTATENIPQPINLRECFLLFYKCECETLDLSDWDFSEIESVFQMFSSSKTRMIVLGDANFDKCRDFSYCFADCTSLEELKLGRYSIQSDAKALWVFRGCTKLLEKYNKTKEELLAIFKSGQWNSLQPVKKSELCKLMEAFK